MIRTECVPSFSPVTQIHLTVMLTEADAASYSRIGHKKAELGPPVSLPSSSRHKQLHLLGGHT
jgi:hypothetical protein